MKPRYQKNAIPSFGTPSLETRKEDRLRDVVLERRELKTAGLMSHKKAGNRAAAGQDVQGNTNKVLIRNKTSGKIKLQKRPRFSRAKSNIAAAPAENADQEREAPPLCPEPSTPQAVRYTTFVLETSNRNPCALAALLPSAPAKCEGLPLQAAIALHANLKSKPLSPMPSAISLLSPAATVPTRSPCRELSVFRICFFLPSEH